MNRQQVHDKYNGKCAYCGEEITLKQMQVDHIIPKYKTVNNDSENLNPSCRSCNFYKGAETIELYRLNISTLINRLEKIFIFRLAKKYGIIKLASWDGKFYYERIDTESEE
jgi:5-methylcytosine-specific restriction endonuclease McrA